MPSLGADMDFGRVVEWRAAPGDAVARGDIVVEVETDKGTFELESPYDGVMSQPTVVAGAKVPVGAILATIGAATPSSPPPTPTAPLETPAQAPPQAAPLAATPPAVAQPAVLPARSPAVRA